ncbi:substrate-binding domain-containing protein [Nocardia gipuzkoensis]
MRHRPLPYRRRRRPRVTLAGRRPPHRRGPRRRRAPRRHPQPHLYARPYCPGRSRCGEHIAALPVGERPDAVFCVNDLLAIGVLQALALHDVAVPADVALVGYDDIDFAQSAVVPLTSIRQPRAEIGSSAIDLLVAAADGGGRAGTHLLPSAPGRARLHRRLRGRQPFSVTVVSGWRRLVSGLTK